VKIAVKNSRILYIEIFNSNAKKRKNKAEK